VCRGTILIFSAAALILTLKWRSHYGRLRRVTAVDGRYVPLTSVDRNRTCANAGDGLQNLALLDVRTSSNARFGRPSPVSGAGTANSVAPSSLPFLFDVEPASACQQMPRVVCWPRTRPSHSCRPGTLVPTHSNTRSLASRYFSPPGIACRRDVLPILSIIPKLH